MFHNTQLRATKIQSWECQHPNENKTQQINPFFLPTILPYDPVPQKSSALGWLPPKN